MQDATTTNHTAMEKLQSLLSENSELRDGLQALQIQIGNDINHACCSVACDSGSEGTEVVLQLPKGISSIEESDDMKGNDNIICVS